jgi:hypothetical protein
LAATIAPGKKKSFPLHYDLVVREQLSLKKEYLWVGAAGRE